jgi:nucleoside-diphosphate-sugar epimerase
MTTLVVVGSGGFIGSNIVSRLKAQKVRVIELSSRNGTGLDPITGLLPAGFTFNEHVDGVVFASQSPRYKSVPASAGHLLAVNSVAPVQVALAAERAGAKNFVYLSTGNVYAPAFEPLNEKSKLSGDNWYSFSKIQGEKALRLLENNLRIIVVRIFAVYGPEQTDKLVANIIQSVDKTIPITLAPRSELIEDGGLRINPCFIDDAVDVLVSLVCNGGPSILNLAGPDVIDVRGIAEAWARLRNLWPTFVNATTPRTTDLIADTSLLNSCMKQSFKSFGHGLQIISALRE